MCRYASIGSKLLHQMITPMAENISIFSNICVSQPGDKQSVFTLRLNCIFVYSITTAMVLSVPFLIATLLIYIYLRDLHKNLHGKCFICYLICQICCFILEILSFNHILDWEAVIIYSFLCAFQWLNVTAFDAWWNLRNFRYTQQLQLLIINALVNAINLIIFNFRRNVNRNSKGGESKRFVLYMLYAILSPFLLNVFQICSDILKKINGMLFS